MKSIVCSGPVIIENDKVLLIKENKNQKITPWLFPGGKVESYDKNLEDACRRESKEEIGVDIEIIKQLQTTQDIINESNVILHHFLCKIDGEIIPGKTIAEWQWFDIKNLPSDCAKNVYQIIEDIKDKYDIQKSRI